MARPISCDSFLFSPQIWRANFLLFQFTIALNDDRKFMATKQGGESERLRMKNFIKSWLIYHCITNWLRLIESWTHLDVFLHATLSVKVLIVFVPFLLSCLVLKLPKLYLYQHLDVVVSKQDRQKRKFQNKLSSLSTLQYFHL